MLTHLSGLPSPQTASRVAADALPGLPKRRPHVPVARAGALRRPREQSAEPLNFPGGDAAHLSGLPARRRP
ncbi:TPA: hypothetical protein ACTYTR_002528 [Klebsiella michiganensis]|uniref:hypothetical protein n=1 Tax=Klebsiella michiganensis TaxID=1134687 RepID=UPI0012BA15B9|nr:hypothetical protein [Klebsiella michiganensis]QLX88230.1 hypothetical protein HV219_13335 [Klebsiella oxytoca]QWA88065.1 hypothetical protein KLH67_18085 [Klebsiella michiganensis]HCF7934859.1 hypothetical protein [Klebsiella michiganensis]HDX8761728.1 hypothetical protein [Klebsiella michiganensis]